MEQTRPSEILFVFRSLFSWQLFFLFSSSADCKCLISKRGSTALETAMSRKHDAVAKLLQEYEENSRTGGTRQSSAPAIAASSPPPLELSPTTSPKSTRIDDLLSEELIKAGIPSDLHVNFTAHGITTLTAAKGLTEDFMKHTLKLPLGARRSMQKHFPPEK